MHTRWHPAGCGSGVPRGRRRRTAVAQVLGDEARQPGGRGPGDSRVIPYTRIEVELLQDGGSQEGEFAIGDLVLASWTGRDRAALELHIDEMEKLGIRRPVS